jgi:hypothetical protein
MFLSSRTDFNECFVSCLRRGDDVGVPDKQYAGAFPKPAEHPPGVTQASFIVYSSYAKFPWVTSTSEQLRRALSSLIARLPQENRDLLLTVTEIINANAQRSEDTRMPLNNLLLVLSKLEHEPIPATTGALK